MHKNITTLTFLTGAFCSSLIISNILAFKTWNMFGFTLPAAVIMFPIVYIINDVLAELYEYEITKNIIITGFIMNIIAVIAYNIAIILPISPFFEGQEAFTLVLSNSLRILIASFTAYIVGSITNLRIMNILKIKDGDNRLAFRCIISTIFGEGIDALLFITIAFIGEMPIINLITMIIAQASFKIMYEIIFYPITYNIIKRIKLNIKGSDINEGNIEAPAGI